MKATKIFILCMCFGWNLSASHLVGGNMGYEYLGLQPNGKYRYKILLTTFVDCSPTSQIPYPEDPLKAGVYAHDFSVPMDDKQRIDSLQLILINTETYTPSLPPGCTVGQNTCIIQGDYEGYIELAASINGYHIYYERCCRNVGIINLQPSQSASFHVYISPTNIVNSSPVFLSSPIPFICANDPTTILNEAMDPDGDSLVFSFSVPYSGFGDVFNTLPQLPSPTLSWPVPPVIYVPGFTATQPFGASGYAGINQVNGTTDYTIPVPGPYVVCIQIDEYRNGQLIGTVRRDLQLLVLPCPSNPPPELSDNLQVYYETETGDTLCFPITFKDPNNDSVFLSYRGDIFESIFYTPNATFSIIRNDSNASTGQFCWTIPCDADTGVFYFNMQADDNGCPPKTTYQQYTIRIHGPQPPVILGPDTVCETTDSVLYHVSGPAGYQYQWQVVNGTIVHNMNDTAIISWGSGTSGLISVIGTNRFGCPAGSDSLTIHLIPVPVLTAMPDDSVCYGDTLLLTASGSPSPWFWCPPGNLLNPYTSSPGAVAEYSQWYYVAGLPDYRCPASDSVYITVWALPVPDVTPDTSICLFDTLQLHAAGGETYLWSPAAGLSDTSIHNPWAYIQSDAQYIVTIADTNQCINKDTVNIHLHPLPALTITGNDSICNGDTTQLMISGGIQVQWFPPDFLSSDTVFNPFSFPATDQAYLITVSDSNQCRTDTTIIIHVLPVPLAAFTSQPLTASCLGFSYQFTNMSTGASSYDWNFNDGTSSPEYSPLHIFPFGQEFIVTLTAYNASCSNTVNDTISIDDLKKFISFNPANVFSPNGDGINDLLHLSLPVEFNDCIRVSIYNRWGSLVYKTESALSDWDGKMPDGAVSSEGVYFYVVEINGLVFNGNVTIFR